jgi:hypothetical protein
VIFAKGNQPQQILFGTGNLGTFSEGDIMGMDFDEEFEQQEADDIDIKSDEDSGEDFTLDDSDENQDVEPEE